MIKKTIQYVDFDGNKREEEFYFNLTEAEVVELELGMVGGLSETLRKIIASEDTPSIIKYFKEIILKSYGEKSPDGKRFVKSEELANAFSQTNAYSNLFMELAMDDKLGAEFVNGILPDMKRISDKIDAQKAVQLHEVGKD